MKQKKTKKISAANLEDLADYELQLTPEAKRKIAQYKAGFNALKGLISGARTLTIRKQDDLEALKSKKAQLEAAFKQMNADEAKLMERRKLINEIAELELKLAKKKVQT